MGASPHAALIMLIPPLFDEANRLRRTLVLTMRALALLGFDSALPDLPGQNESLLPTEVATLHGWRQAFATLCAAADRPVISAAWRAGALIDSEAELNGRWRMAPLAGASVVRTLARAKTASEREAGRNLSLDDLLATMRTETTEVAGNRLSSAMIAELEAAEIQDVEPVRTVAVGNGEGALPGSPLWLRAEPGEDAAMAHAMATDIAIWTRTCVGS
jgi:hypothetical protein